MLLEGDVMPKVFMIYGAFWIFVLLALFVGLGLLMKRYPQPGDGEGPSAGGHH